MKYAIVISFETERPLPRKVLDDVAGAAWAQLEGLSEDHGREYSNASLYAGTDHERQLARALSNAAKELGQYDNANSSDGVTEKHRVRAIKWAQRVLKSYRERFVT